DHRDRIDRGRRNGFRLRRGCRQRGGAARSRRSRALRGEASRTQSRRAVAARSAGEYDVSLNMARRIVAWGVAGGNLIALLKLIEYKHFVHEYPAEIYGGLVALIFTAIGIYLGLKWTRTRQPAGGAFVLNEASLRDLGITPREHEILALIAQGLSNREI